MSNLVGGEILDPIVGVAAFLIFSWITVRFGVQIAAGIVKIGLAFVVILGPLMLFAPLALLNPWVLLGGLLVAGGGILTLIRD
ncbi:hypothetical protein BDK61_2880 [Haloarcula quadrata]|uniref:Uncharacterized protein n=1 Tax=Haloarcula quadrata TaxID=182779 RepID=A0A495R886_9EURY|nr:hypothetical protein BDK61_2880 [Haloarcula quadrata]